MGYVGAGFGPVTMDRGRHSLPIPCELSHYLHRQFPEWDGKRKPELFVYKHEKTGNFMVALWMDRDKGVFLELAVIGQDLHRLPPRIEDLLRLRLTPTGETPESRIEKLKAKWAEEDRREFLSGERHTEAEKSFRWRGN